jgi:hypothetical protein
MARGYAEAGGEEMGTSLGFVPYITTLRAMCGEFAICFWHKKSGNLYMSHASECIKTSGYRLGKMKADRKEKHEQSKSREGCHMRE